MGEYFAELAGRLDARVVRQYCAPDEKGAGLRIEVGLDDEFVRICRLSDGSYDVVFVGAESALMLRTVTELRLQSGWPSSLGEKVFHVFAQHLKDQQAGPVELTQNVVGEKERQFGGVIKRLSDIYAGRLGR